MKRYLLRSLKYFLKLTVILVVILAVLVAAKMIPSKIDEMFVNGYDSLWQIVLVIAGLSLLYPRFGYGVRSVFLPGAPEEVWPKVVKAMAQRGYIPAPADSKPRDLEGSEAKSQAGSEPDVKATAPADSKPGAEESGAEKGAAEESGAEEGAAEGIISKGGIAEEGVAKTVFRSSSSYARILRLGEDRLTFEKTMSGYDIEGRVRDLTRVAAFLETICAVPDEK